MHVHVFAHVHCMKRQPNQPGVHWAWVVAGQLDARFGQDMPPDMGVARPACPVEVCGGQVE